MSEGDVMVANATWEEGSWVYALSYSRRDEEVDQHIADIGCKIFERRGVVRTRA